MGTGLTPEEQLEGSAPIRSTDRADEAHERWGDTEATRSRQRPSMMR